MHSIKLGEYAADCPVCGEPLTFVVEGEERERQPLVGTVTLNVVAKLFEPHGCFKAGA